MDYFPNVEQIKARLAAQARHPSEWREINLKIIREFLTKAVAVGIQPPVLEGRVAWVLTVSRKPSGEGVVGYPYMYSGYRSKLRPIRRSSKEGEVQHILLCPRPSPFWITRGIRSNDYHMAYEPAYSSFEERVEIEDLDELSQWNPVLLQQWFADQLPT